tara:strand:+ start:572 stop:700 length:129 start_codon:yes stop_codon:yes gene_type:complete
MPVMTLKVAAEIEEAHQLIVQDQAVSFLQNVNVPVQEYKKEA